MSVQINQAPTSSIFNHPKTSSSLKKSDKNSNFNEILEQNIPKDDKTTLRYKEYSAWIEEHKEFNPILSFEQFNKIEDFYEELSKFSTQELAQINFQKALNALDKLVDKNTGAKIDFNSLSTSQKDDLLHFLSGQVADAQTRIGEWLEYSKVEISFQDDKLFVSSEFVNLQGEVKNKELEKGFMTGIGYSLDMIPIIHYEDEAMSDEQIEKSVLELASKGVSQSTIDSYKEQMLYNQIMAELINNFLNSYEKTNIANETLSYNEKLGLQTRQNGKSNEILQELLRQI